MKRKKIWFRITIWEIKWHFRKRRNCSRRRRKKSCCFFFFFNRINFNVGAQVFETTFHEYWNDFEGFMLVGWRFINEILASRIYLLQEKTSIRTCIGETSSEITGRGQTEIKVIEHSAGPCWPGLTNSQRQTTNTWAIFVRGNYKTVSGVSSF